MNFSKVSLIKTLPFATFLALSVTACSDDSSSSPTSSGSEAQGSQQSSTQKKDDPEAISEIIQATEGVEGCETAPYTFAPGFTVTCDGTFLGNLVEDSDTTPYDPAATYTDFVSLPKIFETLQQNESIVFLLRHGDRQSGSGSESVLTGLGKFQAQYVGSRVKSDEEFFFAHSNYKRTEETAENISIGKGQTNFNHKAMQELGGGWYTKDQDKLTAYEKDNINGQHVLSQWAFEGNFADAFYDLNERSEELINAFKEKLVAYHRVSFAISHDQLILPFAAYATNKKIDLYYSDTKNWLNFLAGVAIIYKADGSINMVPVKGLDSGLQ